MITPLDIQNHEFSKGVRGYKEEEVDGFLDLLTMEFEKLINENEDIKDQLKTVSSELSRYRNTEGMVLETLEAAKALMGDISVSAEKRAEILLKNAEMDADRIVKEAKEAAERLREENVDLRNSLTMFRTKYKALLESELEKFDLLSAEIFKKEEEEDLKGLVDGDINFKDKTIFNFRPRNE